MKTTAAQKAAINKTLKAAEHAVVEVFGSSAKFGESDFLYDSDFPGEVVFIVRLGMVGKHPAWLRMGISSGAWWGASVGGRVSVGGTGSMFHEGEREQWYTGTRATTKKKYPTQAQWKKLILKVVNEVGGREYLAPRARKSRRIAR